MDREILIIVDPMCSWCWGFSPVLRALDEAYNNYAPVFPIVGGLRPLTSDPMNDRAKEEIQQHWKNVNEASGQPFDFSFFDRKNFIYDTEPACRALVTVRFLKPKCSLAFLELLHQAFYAENRDITDSNVLASLAEVVGVDPSDFKEFFPTRKMVYLTASDFFRSQSMGVSGFPTIILRSNEKLSLLSTGYQPLGDIRPKIDDWLKNKGVNDASPQ